MNYSAAFELVVLKVLCINEQYAIKVSAMKKCGIIFFAICNIIEGYSYKCIFHPKILKVIIF